MYQVRVSVALKLVALPVALAWAAACNDDDPAAAHDVGGSDARGADAGPIDDSATIADSAPTCDEAAVRPGPRAETMGVFDPLRRRLVFFGGDDAVPVNCQPRPHPIGELWVYDAVCATFEQIMPAAGAAAAPARTRGMAVYDADGDRMLVFGGRYREGTSGPYTVYNDVWALDLKTLAWSEVQASGTKPVARSNPAGGYNAATREMIVFGGNSSTNGLQFIPHGDVWAFNLKTGGWREIKPTGPAPAARLFHAAAVDSANNLLYVYGGGAEQAWLGGFMGDLWQLDLNSGVWSQLHAGGAEAPQSRIWGTLAFDPAKRRLLLFGGHDSPPGTDAKPANDTWAFDLQAKRWSQITPGEPVKERQQGVCQLPVGFTEPDLDAPERRQAHLAALDPQRGEWIIFGGKTDCGLIDDVWTFVLARDAWLRLMPATAGEACLRGDSPEQCVAYCQ